MRAFQIYLATKDTTAGSYGKITEAEQEFLALPLKRYYVLHYMPGHDDDCAALDRHFVEVVLGKEKPAMPLELAVEQQRRLGFGEQ